MKKLHLVSTMIIASIISSAIIASEGTSEYKQPSLKKVIRGKAERQRELARPPVYKMIDPLVVGRTTDWSVLFSILDSMKGVINVNEYRTLHGDTLLAKAYFENNLSAAKTLLEKYRANPDLLSDNLNADSTVLLNACAKGNAPFVKLLLQYGANPNLEDDEGSTSFDYAKTAEIRKLLAPFKE